jgi:hypothetical protein
MWMSKNFLILFIVVLHNEILLREIWDRICYVIKDMFA